jgi:hypothetical protein
VLVHTVMNSLLVARCVIMHDGSSVFFSVRQRPRNVIDLRNMTGVEWGCDYYDIPPPLPALISSPPHSVRIPRSLDQSLIKLRSN